MNQLDKRSLTAIAMCVVFYLAYTSYLNHKYPNQGRKPAQPVASEAGTKPTASPGPGSAGSPAATAGTGAPTARSLSPTELRLESDVLALQFTQETGAITSVVLKPYQSTSRDDPKPIDLVDSPLYVLGTTDPAAGARSNLPTPGSLLAAERQGDTLKLWREQGAFRVSQIWRLPASGYGAELKVTFTNISKSAVDLTAGVIVSGSAVNKSAPGLMRFLPGSSRIREQLVYQADGSTEWVDAENLCKDDKGAAKLAGVPVSYFGFDHHYFLTAFEPKAKTGNLRLTHEAPLTQGGPCALTLVSDDRQGLIQPGETVTVDYGAFFGPKDLKILGAHNQALESAMNLGRFGFIGRPLLSVIEAFEKVTHNFGLAIILVTLCLKLLFFPLVRASSVSMHRMKKLNPEMQAIRDKWKEDRQRQQLELMKFMQQHKINPAKGCLPILPQIPVFFAFYQVLQNSIQLRHAPFYGWITDLAAMDPFLVTPLLMGVAMVAQQKLTPTSGMDKTQEKILMFMPIMFTAMMLSLPAGLTLYMLTNTLVGIAQQKWLLGRLDRAQA